MGLADLDADGDLDAVSADGGVRAALNDGVGGFGDPVASPGPGQDALALGDFDGDGAYDLLLANYPFPDDSPVQPPEHTRLGFGDGRGAFPVAARVLPLATSNPSVADLDGDGDLDAVVSVYGGSYLEGLFVLSNDGTGRLDRRFLDVPSLDGWGVALGDVDLDGDVDVLATSQVNRIALLENEGGGSFAAPTYFDAGQVPWGGWGPARLALADLDQDGLLDLAAGYHGAGVAVLWGTAPGAFGPAEPVAFTDGLVRPRELEVADVDVDDAADVVVAYEGYGHQDIAGGLAVLRNLGGRHLEWSWSFGPGTPGTVSAGLGDVDRDGRVDVLASRGGFYDSGPVQGAPGGSDLGARLYLNRYVDPPECSDGERYCVAKLNSAGCLPRLCSRGAPSASGPDDFQVSGHALVSNQVAILVWGTAQAALPFGGGSLCVAPPFVRVGPQSTGGTAGVHDCSGHLSFHLAQADLLAQGLAPGDALCVQMWTRDPYLPAPSAIGLTDALRFVMGP